MESVHLRQLTREAARQAFSELRAAHPDEHFYSYALYTDEGVMTLLPAANSEEAWKRKTAQVKHLSYSMANYYRWAAGEWEYESWGNAPFQPVQEYLNGPAREDGAASTEENDLTDEDLDEDPAFTALREQVLAAMTDTLQDLDAEGFFGSGEARQQITLFVTISDSDEHRSIEDASASVLNPPVVFERFAARYS